MSRPFDMAEFMENEKKDEAIAIQQEVVEQLAAEKAELHEAAKKIEEHNANLSAKLESQRKEIETLKAANDQAINQINDVITALKSLVAEKESLEKELASAREEVARLDKEMNATLAAQTEESFNASNSVSLLDRDMDLPDRFIGETRDHVLEVIKEARDAAEAAGRTRRAQLLEGVLVANSPEGSLATKRAALEKFFNENGNVINGAVIAELERCGIPYKNGDTYLLTKEILQRTY